MPTYGYCCTECNHTFEVFQRITDEPLRECEKCKGPVRRLLYPVGVVFKGPGFHINDYCKPAKKNGEDHEDKKSEAKPANETVKEAAKTG